MRLYHRIPGYRDRRCIPRIRTAHTSCTTSRMAKFPQGKCLLCVQCRDTHISQLWWAEGLVYYVACMSVKLSITLMLLRFVVEESHKRVVIIMGCMLQVYSVAFTFIYAFQCVPVTFFWTRAQGDISGRCLKLDKFFAAGYVYVGLNVLFDISMAIMPWLIVRKMQHDLRTRLMVTSILALGSM